MKEKEKKGTHSDHDEAVAATPSSLWYGLIAVEIKGRRQRGFSGCLRKG